MAEIPDTIIEEREELMVSSTGDANPTLRIAHFLRPSITEPVKGLPPPPDLSSKPTSPDLKNVFQKVQFNGRRGLNTWWKTWVDRLHSTYQTTWKKGGIFEAIMCSDYKISKHDDLIFGVAENWCSETNTFIFPWGEATITLEDMMVLGGYSAVGDSVLSRLEIEELKEAEETLIEAYREIRRLTGQYPRAKTWFDYFFARIGCKVEHEAFLSLWLSRYVFPTKHDLISKHLFPAAVRLARGIPVALAPAVLAGIYRDLCSLKEKIVHSNKVGTDEDKDVSKLCLSAPLHLVQLWVWERFPTLRPTPNLIKCGEPRLARWHKRKIVQVENVRLAIDSEGECFQWRPYAAKNWSLPMFYKENEEWVVVDSDLDDELESFARCMRVSELVGFDCIEQYLPHRVAMQFGLDQDVPGRVFRSNETNEIAWSNYNRPIKDAKLFIPSRLFESDVTVRYLKWWRGSMLAPHDANWGVLRRPRSLPKSAQNVKRCKKAEDSVNEDRLTIKELSQLTDKQHSTENRPVGDVEPLLLDIDHQTLSSCNTGTVMNKEEKLPMKSIEKNVKSEALVKESENAGEDIKETNAEIPVIDIDSQSHDNEVRCSYSIIEIPGLDLEARIIKLEKVIAGLKTCKSQQV